MLLNQDQDLLADLSIAICSSFSSPKPAHPQTYKTSDIIKYNVLIGEAELSKLKVDLDEVEFFL